MASVLMNLCLVKHVRKFGVCQHLRARKSAAIGNKYSNENYHTHFCSTTHIRMTVSIFHSVCFHQLSSPYCRLFLWKLRFCRNKYFTDSVLVCGNCINKIKLMTKFMNI